MAFSGDIWVLNKLCDLAVRCGIDPVYATVSLQYHFSDQFSPPLDSGFYSLSMTDGDYCPPELESKMELFKHLLKFDETDMLSHEFKEIWEVDALVNDALARAPRARARER